MNAEVATRHIGTLGARKLLCDSLTGLQMTLNHAVAAWPTR